MEGHVILGKLDLQGQPPLNETLPKDKSETQADRDEECYHFCQERHLPRGKDCDG